MVDASNITTIPPDTSSPWSHITCRGNGNGNSNLVVPFYEIYSSSQEEGVRDSTPSLGHSDASTDVSSIKNLDIGYDDIGKDNGELSKKVPGTSSLIGLSGSIDDEMLCHHGPDLEVYDDGDRAENALPVTESYSRTTDAEYSCVTETNGCSEVRLGYQDKIPRWIKDAELSYVVCLESFPISLKSLVEDAMREAISMWRGHGVKFKQVQRNSKATFAVMYENYGNGRAYACAFFPNEERRKLVVYSLSLTATDFLANILAHEIGHILGLRHEFAHRKERNNPSVCFGSENAKSIMNYHCHPRDYKVRIQDLEDLERLYATKSQCIRVCA